MELSSILILLESCLQTWMTFTIAVCTVKNCWWWTKELSETSRVSFQNKFEKLVYLVGFSITIICYCSVTATIKLFMVLPCFDNIKFFIFQLMHVNYIKMWIIKTFKIITVAPTCFGLCKPSSGNHNHYLAKITLMVHVYITCCYRRIQCYGHICGHNTEYVGISEDTRLLNLFI
jgi:hypothetical protein